MTPCAATGQYEERYSPWQNTTGGTYQCVDTCNTTYADFERRCYPNFVNTYVSNYGTCRPASSGIGNMNVCSVRIVDLCDTFVQIPTNPATFPALWSPSATGVPGAYIARVFTCLVTCFNTYMTADSQGVCVCTGANNGYTQLSMCQSDLGLFGID